MFSTDKIARNLARKLLVPSLQPASKNIRNPTRKIICNLPTPRMQKNRLVEKNKHLAGDLTADFQLQNPPNLKLYIVYNLCIEKSTKNWELFVDVYTRKFYNRISLRKKGIFARRRLPEFLIINKKIRAEKRRKRRSNTQWQFY